MENGKSNSPIKQFSNSSLPVRRVRVEIDLSELVSNYRKIAAAVAPVEVLCVLKANAYGLGVGAYAEALANAGCSYFGVAEPFEALELKRALAGRGSTIQMLSSVLPGEIPAMVEAGIVLPATGLEEAEAISRAACATRRTARVHLKIDSGMGRLGILIRDAPDTVRRIAALPNLDCEGIMTHCPMAYAPDDPFTAEQIASFKRLVASLAEEGIKFRRIHIAASDAINNFPECAQSPFTTVRTGINLHGSFDPNGRRALDVRSVLTLKTRVAQVRTLPPGTTLGYGRTWCLAGERRIATISAGYADGLPLALSNRGLVLIKGAFCPVVGRISMDYATVDVSHVPGVEAGDEVVCLGRDGSRAITPDDWAALKGTHAYDIICSFGSRVERQVLRDPSRASAVPADATVATVALGSNIHPRRNFLAKAIDALSALPDTQFLSKSSIYETEPEGVPEEFKEQMFLNQVAMFRTSLPVERFAELMHGVEDSLGRVRSVKNGPRTIDLDLVTFGDVKMDSPSLTLPHPRAAARSFVQLPLSELKRC